MWPKSWIAGKDDVLEELKRWEGATAQAWEYSVGHSQFLMRLHHQQNSEAGSLFVYLKGCDRVSFVSTWRNAKIEVEEKEGSLGPVFVVQDHDRLCVHSHAVFATKSTDYGLKLSHQFE